MNFKEIIKQEWEKEFPDAEGLFETSIFNQGYGELTNRICTIIWNEAIEVAADNAEADVTILTEEGQYEMSSIQLGYDYECYVLKESILNFKL